MERLIVSLVFTATTLGHATTLSGLFSEPAQDSYVLFLQTHALSVASSMSEEVPQTVTEKTGGADLKKKRRRGHKLVAAGGHETLASAARKAQAWKLHKQAIEAEPTLSSTLTVGGALGAGQSATTFGPSNTPLASQALCNALDNNATSLRSQGPLLNKLLDMWTAAHPNGIIYSDDSSRGCIAQDNSAAGPENEVLRRDTQVFSFVTKPEGQICKIDGKTHMEYGTEKFEVFGKMRARSPTRNYVAVYPSSVRCTKRNPCPSVFALHGIAEATDPKLLESWGLLRYARHDKHCLRGLGSVLVFPQLVEGESWVADGPLVFDNFVVPLVEKLVQNGNLDRDRVAILGYSAGAVGALIAAIRRPDIFAVAVAAAASLPQDAWDKVSTERFVPETTPQVRSKKKLNLLGLDSQNSLRTNTESQFKLKLVMIGLGLNDTENDVQPDRNFGQILRVLGEARIRTQLNVRLYEGLQHPEVWEAVFNHWGNFHEVLWKGRWDKLYTPWGWYREILIALAMVIIGSMRVHQNLQPAAKKDVDRVEQSNEASKPSGEKPQTEKIAGTIKATAHDEDCDEKHKQLEAVRHEISANKQQVVSHASHLPLSDALECLDAESDRAALGGTGDRRPLLTHKQLFELVARQGDDLKRILGDGSKAHVAVVMPQGSEALTVLLACFAAGIARTAPIDPKLSGTEISRILKDATLAVTAALISSGEAGAAARAAVSETQLPVVLVNQASAATGSGSFELQNTKCFEVHSFDIQKYRKSENPLLMLSTSGTTGKAKWVQQPASGILLGARLIAGSLNLKPRDVQLNVMPLHHIGGICCSFASIVSGGTLLCAEAFEPDGFCEQLRSSPAPTWYYSAPTIHQAVANAVSEQKPQHSLRLARSGAAAIPPALVEKLGETLGCVVLPTYSMSECMPICGTPIDGAGLDNSSVGTPIGPSLRIADPDGHSMPYGTLGEVQIKQSGLVTPGYLGEGGELSDRTKDGWLRTGDLGMVDEKGYVKLTGRSKEVINRAGETLAPSAVEDCLMRLPNIADVMAFAIPSKDLGETVAAVVVPMNADEATVSLAQIWRGLEGNTARNLWPELLIYMDSIPKGRTGKKLRVGFDRKLQGFAGKLPAAYRGVPEEANGPVQVTEIDTGLGGPKSHDSSSTEGEVSAQGSVEGPKAQLFAIWREVLGLSPGTKVDEDASLWTLGGRSQELAMIVARVRATFGFTAAQLPITTAMASPTLAGIAKVVERIQGKLASKSGEMKSSNGELLVPLGADSAEDRPIVIIVAGRAKSVLRFGPLASAFPNIQFFGIERPGRGARASDKVENNPSAEAQDVAHQFAVAIAERVGDKPVVLAGACFGCLWAFAVAYELEQIGCRPARLVTFDGGCPSQDSEAYTKQTALIADFLSSGPSDEDVDNFMKALQNEHEKFDDEMGMDLLQCWQWDNEAYTTLLQELAPKSGESPVQINCPISVFRATEDQDAFMRFRDDREWARYTTTGPFGYTPMKVTHFELMSTVMQKAEHDADFRVELEGLFDASTSTAGADESDGDRLVCPWQFFSRLDGANISLIDEKEERVSQAELAQFARDLASWMHGEGVEAGSKVLLLSIPSRFCLASQLALIHLGAVAVPMNEEAGESGEYLQQLGETAGCTHLLCEEAPSLPMFCSLRVLAAKTGFDKATAQATAAELVPAFVARSAAATILFSSGSTGKPKGVVQSVGSLLDLAADTVPQAAPRLWSGSIGWIANYALPPALVGQSLLVVPSKVRADPFLFQGIRSRNGVERLTISPSELRAFLAVPGCLKDLSTIVCMAEALPQSVALDYYAQYPSSRLEETYASSEVQGTNAFLSTAVPRDGTTGRFKVRAGQGAVLLDPKDPSRKVEAIGEVGELLLVPTAGGYLNSEQTKQRFIPNPFGPGQLFRTGDLCSWVDAETLKIEGRVDFQVKVSGQLVALEQVEAAAESLDGIKAAAARTFVRASGTTAIALYLAGNEKMGVDGARTALAKKLPSYAIPANIEFLDSIPLLPSGKKDRKSLPEPEDSEDVTDSIGLVRTVGMRQAMEHDAGQALFGLSALALPLLHWLPHEMPNESAVFQKEMDVLQVMASHLSVPLLAVVVGYIDGRAARTTREVVQQCIMVYAIYVLMAWPLLVGSWARGIATFHRWSCIAFVMYRFAPVALKYFKVPIWAAVAFCYVLAPVLGRRPLDIPMVREGPNAWQEPSLIFFEPQFYGTVGMMFKDFGSYLMAYYLASALVPNMMQSVFKRSTKVAILAGCTWALLTIAQTFVDDPYDSSKAPEVADWPRYFGYCYPLRVVIDWISVACLVTCVGEGCTLLRMMGRSLVGTFLVHMYFEINLAAIISGLRPLGGPMQLPAAVFVTACYVLTIGSLAQILVVGLLRVFKMN